MARRVLSPLLIVSLLVVQIALLPAVLAQAEVGQSCNWTAVGVGFGNFVVVQDCDASTDVQLPGDDSVQAIHTPTLIVVSEKESNTVTGDHIQVAGLDLGDGNDSATLNQVSAAEVYETNGTDATSDIVHFATTMSDTSPFGGTLSGIHLGDGDNLLDIVNSAGLTFGTMGSAGNNGADTVVQGAEAALDVTLGNGANTTSLFNLSTLDYTNGSLAD